MTDGRKQSASCQERGHPCSWEVDCSKDTLCFSQREEIHVYTRAFHYLRTAAHPAQGRLCWGLRGHLTQGRTSSLPLRSALLGPSHTPHHSGPCHSADFSQRPGGVGWTPAFPPSSYVMSGLSVWRLSSKLYHACLLLFRETASTIGLYTRNRGLIVNLGCK